MNNMNWVNIKISYKCVNMQLKSTINLLTALFLTGCVTSNVMSSAQVSYRTKTNVNIEDKLAMFSMMSAGSSSFNDKSGSPKIAEAPYSPARIVEGHETSLPTETSIEGFCSIANDILLAKLGQQKPRLTIIPPKQVQSTINQLNITAGYLDFLKTYKYLSANSEFLKKLGDHLNCRYVIIPQLVVISNINDNSMFLVWAFGKKSTDYSVIILAHVWDMSTGELIWTGRGTSTTNVGTYEKPASFDELAAEAAVKLIELLP